MLHLCHKSWYFLNVTLLILDTAYMLRSKANKKNHISRLTQHNKRLRLFQHIQNKIIFFILIFISVHVHCTIVIYIHFKDIIIILLALFNFVRPFDECSWIQQKHGEISSTLTLKLYLARAI